METSELKKELKKAFPKLRAVRKGKGSMRGYIEICAALYDDPERWSLRDAIRTHIKISYPELLVNVY